LVALHYQSGICNVSYLPEWIVLNRLSMKYGITSPLYYYPRFLRCYLRSYRVGDMKPCKCCIDCYALDGKRELCYKTNEWVKDYTPQGFDCPLDYGKKKYRSKHKRKAKPLHLPKERLISLISNGMDVDDIEDMFGVSRSWVYKKMQDYGIKIKEVK